MTGRTPLTLTGDLHAAAQRLREIATATAALDAEARTIKDLLRAAVPPGTTCVDADGVELVAVRPGAARFNPQRATEVLPADLLASISVTAPDAKRAKDILAPALFAACTVQSQAAVAVLS